MSWSKSWRGRPKLSKSSSAYKLIRTCSMLSKESFRRRIWLKFMRGLSALQPEKRMIFCRKSRKTCRIIKRRGRIRRDLLSLGIGTGYWVTSTRTCSTNRSTPGLNVATIWAHWPSQSRICWVKLIRDSRLRRTILSRVGWVWLEWRWNTHTKKLCQDFI